MGKALKAGCRQQSCVPIDCLAESAGHKVLWPGTAGTYRGVTSAGAHSGGLRRVEWAISGGLAVPALGSRVIVQGDKGLALHSATHLTLDS